MWFPSLSDYARLSFLRAPARSRRRSSARSASGLGAALESLEDRCLLSFSPLVSYEAGDNPQAIVTADFNRDGRLDLVVANSGSNSVSVLLGRADGTFGTAAAFPSGAAPRSLAVGDFNNDGSLDLATAGEGASVSVLLGDGAGRFAAPRTMAVSLPVDPSVQLDALSVAVGDFNKDGKLDLAATSQEEYSYGGYYSYYGWWGGTAYRGYVNVLLGDGTGGFSAQNTTQINSGSPLDVEVADLNADGKLDVVTANEDTGTVSVLLGIGDGTLGTARDFTTGWYPRAVTVGDFTGDGKLDLVTAGQSVDVLPGLGDGTFQGVARQYVDPVAIAAADFNGDGRLDVVTADPGSDVVGVLLGRGNGTLTLPVEFVAASQPTAVAVGDFNGDGHPDVAAANAGSGNVSVLLNNGIWPALDAPSLRINDVTVTEGNTGTTNATFTVTLSASYNRDVTVRFATTDGYSWSTATAGSDYEARSGQVTIRAGQTTATVVVPVSGDLLGEETEYFFVRLSDPANAFITDSLGVGTILDDEPRITLDSSGPFVTEGNTGTRAVNFTVRLSAASTAPVSVNFSTAEGDTQWSGSWNGYYYYGTEPAPATGGVDFQSHSGTLTFNPGETAKTITVLVNGDRIAEQNETFSLDLSGAVAGLITGGHAVGTIVDDEPRIFIDSASVTEGHAGTATMNFAVRLSAAFDQEVRVDYSTEDASATAGTDYQAKTGTLVFAPGQTTATVSVLVYGDRVAESNEAFYLVLSTPTANALVTYDRGYGTIIDDEPRIDIGSASVVERNSGTTTAVFTVTLSAPSSEPVSVNFSAVEGDALWWEYNWYYGPSGEFATAGVDFEAQTGTLTFAPGQTSRTVGITVYGDRIAEYDEFFYVELSDPTPNAMISSGWGLATIIEDEPYIGLDSQHVSLTEGDSGVTYMTFTVRLSAPLNEPVTVNFATQDGSATAGSDYQSQSGTLTFAAGVTSMTVKIAIYGDTLVESDEYFYLMLSDPSGNVRFNNYSWGIGYIVNNDGLSGGGTNGNKGKGGGSKK